MRLLKATITNFRGIRDISMEFNPRINVFVGENGSGKTALLSAMSIALSDESDVGIVNSDITKGESISNIRLLCESFGGLISEEVFKDINDEEFFPKKCILLRGSMMDDLVEWLYSMDRMEGCEHKTEVVKYALKEFLPEFSDFSVVGDHDVLLPNLVSNIRMVAVKNGETFEMSQLSSGELAIIELIGSFAMSMAINYPKHENSLSCNSIAFINDIDMHLHPKLQRMMVPKLLDIFPYCQFFISTNSPHVINHVKPESVFMLENEDGNIVVKKPSDTYGMNVDMVLKSIMGMDTTRPDIVHKNLHSVFVAIKDGRLNDARNQIAVLLDEIGVDPELVKAGVLINRYEIIGR